MLERAKEMDSSKLKILPSVHTPEYTKNKHSIEFGKAIQANKFVKHLRFAAQSIFKYLKTSPKGQLEYDPTEIFI